jgi:ATP-dependent protease ClpP protease subunit
MNVVNPLEVLIEEVVENLKTPQDPYKYHAPVVKTTDGYTIHITDDVVEPAEYARIVDVLRNAKDTDTIIVYVTTYGGYSDTADLLRQSIIKSPATVIGRAAGTVASAGTIIFIACDEYEITPTTTFLFHEGSGGTGPVKHSDAQAAIDFTKKHLPDVFKTAYGELLTPKEYKELSQGKELFLSGRAVTERLLKLGKTII